MTGILWFAVAAVLIGRSMTDAGEAAFAGERVELICDGFGIDTKEAERIRASEQEKEDGVEFTAWSEKKHVMIQSADGYRSVQTNIVEISGSSGLLFPAGKQLNEGDTQSCLIGEETAMQLFGSRHAEGAELCYQERRLIVRGVISAPGTLLVVEAEGAECLFQRITLKPPQGIAGRACAERFAGTYGLSVTQVRYDLFSGERFLEMIPGKWSDFSGWRQSIRQFGGDITTLLFAEKSSMEERYLILYAKSAVWMTAGLICLSVGCGRLAKILRM